jgi:hypothetical protein
VAFAIVSVFALLVAGGFAVWSLTRPDGASDPEQAVRNLFTAIDNEDAIGVMETLPPSERGIIRDAVLDSISNLQRLGVLSDFDEHKVPGATFDVRNLELSSSPLSSDVVAVSVTGGSITTTTYPDQAPVGDLLREKVGDELAKAKPVTTTEDLAKDHLRLATVHEKGGWHVSLFYSIAEAARGKSGPPAFGQGPTPKGADTPDGAVREMVRAGTDLDPELAIQMLPPDEMRVMYDYSSLFLPDAKNAAAEAKRDGYKARVDRLDLRTEGDGDTRRVYANAIDVTASYNDDELHLTYDGQCYHVTEKYLAERSYRSQPEDDELCRDGTMRSHGTTNPRSSSTVPSQLLGNGTVDFGVTVVQVDGRWYVSPTRTFVDTMLTGLRNFKRDDLEKLLDSGLFGRSSSGTFSSPYGSGTVPPYNSGTVPRGTIPGSSSGTSRAPSTQRPRATTSTTVDPVCEDDPSAPECGFVEEPSTTSTTRRSSTTTTEDGGSNDEGGVSPGG